MKECSEPLLTFLSREWWQSVLSDWNTVEARSGLAGLGVVCFETVGVPHVTAVRFDDQGRGTLVDPLTPSVGRFSATEKNWRSFIRGRFSAPEGVLRGRIEFAGSYEKVILHANSFTKFARNASKFLDGVE